MQYYYINSYMQQQKSEFFYRSAGTVEYLYDGDSGKLQFLILYFFHL